MNRARKVTEGTEAAPVLPTGRVMGARSPQSEDLHIQKVIRLQSTPRALLQSECVKNRAGCRGECVRT